MGVILNAFALLSVNSVKNLWDISSPSAPQDDTTCAQNDSGSVSVWALALIYFVNPKISLPFYASFWKNIKQVEKRLLVIP